MIDILKSLQSVTVHHNYSSLSRSYLFVIRYQAPHTMVIKMAQLCPGGAPDFTRRTLVFLLLDFGMWGSQARRCPLNQKGENVQFGKTNLLKI